MSIKITFRWAKRLTFVSIMKGHLFFKPEWCLKSVDTVVHVLAIIKMKARVDTNNAH